MSSGDQDIKNCHTQAFCRPLLSAVLLHKLTTNDKGTAMEDCRCPVQGGVRLAESERKGLKKDRG